MQGDSKFKKETEWGAKTLFSEFELHSGVEVTFQSKAESIVVNFTVLSASTKSSLHTVIPYLMQLIIGSMWQCFNVWVS